MNQLATGLGFLLGMTILLVAFKSPDWDRRYRGWKWWRGLSPKQRADLVALHTRPAYGPRVFRQVYGVKSNSVPTP